MRRYSLLLIAAALLFALSALAAGTPTQIYNAGNARYAAGNYDDAIKLSRVALDQGGASADLYYNLGNAFLKAGQLGPAIVAYERGRRLKPRDPDIAHNLRFARVQIKGKLPQVERGFWLQTWDQARDSFSLNELLTLLSIGWFLLGLGLASRIFFRPAGLRTAASAVLGAGLALLVLFGPLTLAKLQEEVWSARAVVQAERTTARSGPGLQNAELFELFEGMEIAVRQCESGYCEVRVPGGLMGWIQSGTFEII